MKSVIIVPLLVMMGFNGMAIGDPQRCECGEFATGIIVFWVNGQCCSGSVLGANVYFYEQEVSGVWSMIGSEIMGNQQAQGACCDLP